MASGASKLQRRTQLRSAYQFASCFVVLLMKSLLTNMRTVQPSTTKSDTMACI